MSIWLKKSALMLSGLFLFSLGILFTIHANLGAAPWDAFHIGIVNYTPFSLGRVGQLVGLVLILICVLLKERPGWGTLVNIYFIGFFIDLIQNTNRLPSFNNFWLQLGMLISGILIIGWGTVIYIGAGWGSGPRDGLMLGLTKQFPLKIWQARTVIEATVCFLAYLLGGPIGLGTIITALLIGPSVQSAFYLARTKPWLALVQQNRPIKEQS